MSDAHNSLSPRVALPHYEYEDTFFLIAEESGQTYPISLSHVGYDESEVVNQIGQNIVLQNVLTELKSARSLAHVPPPVNSKEAFAKTMQRAEYLFGIAMMGEVIADPEVTEQRSRYRVRTLFSDFLKKYYLRGKYKDAEGYRRELADETTQLIWLNQSEANRASHRRPYRRKKKDETKVPTKDLETLSTPEKLKVLKHRDQRAGFYPTTNLEKNMAVSFLDYLDNPEFPLNLHNFYLAVFNKSVVNGRRIKGLKPSRPPESIVYVMTDFLRDAISTRISLGAIEDEVTGMDNPTITLGTQQEQEGGVIKPGYRALRRYMDIDKVTKEAVEDRAIRVLHTNELEIEPDPTAPGRHRYKGDDYTFDFLEPAQAHRAQMLAEKMKVGDIKRYLPIAQPDAIARENFWCSSLSLVASPPEEMPERARKELDNAIWAAREALDQAYPA